MIFKAIIRTLICCFLFTSSLQAMQGHEFLWQNIIKKYSKIEKKRRISTRLFDYEGLQESQSLNTLIRIINKCDLSKLETKNDTIAFWINIYNIAALNLAKQYYPVYSIRNISRDEKSYRLMPAISIQDKIYSLENILHILQSYNEPLIYFALCDTTISDPMVAETPYTGNNIKKLFETQKNIFISDKYKGLKLKNEVKEAYISSIFKRYNNQFGGKEKIIKLIETHLDISLANYKIYYMPHEYDLNSYD